MDLNVTVFLNKNSESSLKANANVAFDNCFLVKGFKVMKRKDNDELFVLMPSYKTANNEYKDSAHPLTSEFRNELIGAIMTAYEAEVAKKSGQAEAAEAAEQPDPVPF